MVEIVARCRYLPEPRRIKKTDASKLQDEYARLVEGLQEASSAEDAFVSNPGKVPFDRALSPDRLVKTLLILGNSATGRSPEGSDPWKHPKGRALRCLPEAFRGVP